MESKIRVEHDFGTSQTWLQLYVSTASREGQPDLRDLALKNFVEEASLDGSELYLEWPPNNSDNSVVQVKVRKKTESENDLNWAGCNATYLAENDPGGVYVKGEKYNLQVATGVGHSIRVRHLRTAVMKEYSEDKVYQDLKTFISIWQIN